ncbi:MAG: hypothetical protein V4582_04590 [Pseudomonadota bacterium]
MNTSLARNTGIATVVLALSACLAGCGQPGDLYLPKAPAKPGAQAKSAPASSAFSALPVSAPAPGTP